MTSYLDVQLGAHTHITKLAGFEYTKHFDYAVGGEIIALRSMNIRNGRLDLTDVHTIPKDVSDALPRSKLLRGDIVLGYIGSKLGNLAQIDEDNRFHLAPNVALIRPSNTVSSEYLSQYMQGPKYQAQLWSLASSTGQPALSMANIRRSKIWLPPLPEQKKIADILTTWDTAIEATEKLLANAEAHKKALMQQLLTGKRRLMGFEGEWAHADLGDVFDRVRRKNFVRNENVLTISGEHGLVSQLDYFNKRVASNDTSKYTLIVKGEFAYNKSYSNGYPLGAIKRLNRYDEGVVSSLYICFGVSNPARDCERFFEHWFEFGGLNRELSVVAQEGARNHGLLNVGVDDFFHLNIVRPSFDQQVAIANVLDVAEKKIASLKQQVDTLKAEKRALMQQLLTGKRRVKV